MSASASGLLVEGGEFPITARDFAAIAGIMMDEAGISLNQSKVNLVYSRLAKRLRILGLQNFAQYCDMVARPDGAAERQEMIAALTTNVTRFFREPHHFDHLRDKIMPGLAEQAKKGSKIRLWSAASSTGQEPYSIAMTVLGVLPDAARYDVKILATDIDPNVLATASAGIYDASALEPVPSALRQRWFAPVREQPGQMRVVDEMRSMITFRKMNLIGQWPMKGKFHVVFCRNVVIYFENPTQEMIWSRILPLLDPHGVLYIGHSERVTGATEAKLRSDGITIYRPVGAT